MKEILTKRPERIAKMALYLQDKEPLIYLFIINSDFYILPENMIETAGVSFVNDRIKFYYNEEFINNLTNGQLLFLIQHEAFHILLKHQERHKNLKNKLLTNIAEDAVINYNILKLDNNYSIKLEKIENGVYAEREYFYNNSEIETFRYYDYLNNKVFHKNDLLRKGGMVKIKNTGEYGIITEELENDNYKVQIGSKEECLNGKQNGKIKTENEDNLIPVIRASKNGYGKLYDDMEVEVLDDTFDYHENNNEENLTKRELFSDKIIQQAEKLENHIRSQAGNINSKNLINLIKKLNEPKINWKKKLRQKLNLFIADNSFIKKNKKSVVNYPWDAKSRYGILGKYNIQQLKNLQSYIIFAIDTSGSVFYSQQDMETFFTEIDHAAKELEFNKKGEILVLQWDTEIHGGIKKYKQGDWKNFKFEGGGGTTPKIVFKYLEDKFIDKDGKYLVKDNDIKFYTQNKKDLPLLIFLTDGDFFSPIKEEDIGIYNEKNLLWFARHNTYIYPKENYIKYE